MTGAVPSLSQGQNVTGVGLGVNATAPGAVPGDIPADAPLDIQASAGGAAEDGVLAGINRVVAAYGQLIVAARG